MHDLSRTYSTLLYLNDPWSLVVYIYTTTCFNSSSVLQWKQNIDRAVLMLEIMHVFIISLSHVTM